MDVFENKNASLRYCLQISVIRLKVEYKSLSIFSLNFMYNAVDDLLRYLFTIGPQYIMISSEFPT